ncbi:hypothetical protein F4781DRAFT_380410 [Annulohypoxylon bovei var. microspora]|nr:hypothetical protein F4781DRAFT_380410 [Annulohypoxylon bovei var. microspora]
MSSDQSDNISYRQRRPSFTTSTTNLIVEKLQSRGDATPASPNLVLLTKLVRIITVRNITEFSLNFGRRETLGEGATYHVSRTNADTLQDTFRGKEKEYIVAVKVAKLNIGRSLKDMGTNETEHRRLKVIISELDMLSRPSVREHPNIASLMGFSWNETTFGYAPCLVMELATLGTARSFTTSKGQALSDLEKLTLCRDIASGLSFLHAHSIVHGDVKQDNVLIYEDKNAAGGFIAKLSDLERCPQASESQTYTGTTLYNAPEVLSSSRGSIKPDMLWRCDVFSFGLLSFEVLASLTWRSVLQKQNETRSTERVDNETLTLAQESIQNNWSFSKELQCVCLEILAITLTDDPIQRLPLTWKGVANILSLTDDNPYMPRDDVETPSHDDLSFSISEIHSSVGTILKDRLGDALLSDLNHTTTNAERDSRQRGSAAFESFLLYSKGRYGPHKSARDAFELLKTAAEFQYGPAFVVGKRIFEANGFEESLPDILLKGPHDRDLHQTITQLECLPNDEYYSSAVRTFWIPKLKLDALKVLPPLAIETSLGSTSSLGSMIQDLQLRNGSDKFLIHHAILKGDYIACELLVQSHCDINTRMPGGMTPLHLACRSAEVDIVKLLLRHHADVGLNDDGNISPLHWLVLFLNEDIQDMIRLLSAGCGDRKRTIASSKSSYPVFFDNLGLTLVGTPLSWAIDCGNFTTVRAMLNADLTPFPSNLGFPQYLSQAASIACVKSVEYFLEFCPGLSIEHINRVYRAVGSGGCDITRWLMHGKSYNKVYGRVFDLLEKFGFKIPLIPSDMDNVPRLSLLGSAVISYNIPLIKELLGRGARINDHSQVHTALGWAFTSADATGPQHKVIDTIKLLLDNGAATSPDTPLHKACTFFVGPNILRLLVDQNPQSVNIVYHGFTPLLSLLSLDIKDDLMAKIEILASPPNADLDIESRHNSREADCCYTALAYSLVNLEWPAAKFLLERNAKLELGTTGGHQHTVLHLLVQQASTMRTQEHATEWGMLLAIIDRLLGYLALKKSNLINIEDYNGVTPLRMAVDFMLPSLVERLLNSKYGIDRNIVEREQRQFLQHRAKVKESDSKISKKRVDAIVNVFEEYFRTS